MLWQPSNNIIAQLAHFGWGALFVASGILFWGSPKFGLELCILWSVPKEWIFDTLVEGADWKDNLLDNGMYLAGAVAMILLWGHFPLTPFCQ